MKKNNKKGFFLSETMVVIAVVAVVLLGVFKLFNSVYFKFIESENYNSVNAINALSNVQKYYESLGNIDTTHITDDISYINLTNYESYNSDYYERLKQEFKIDGIYLIDLNKLYTSDINDFYINFRKYLNTLKNIQGIVLVISIDGKEFAYTEIENYQSVTLIGDKEDEFAVYVPIGGEFVDPGYKNWEGEEPTITWENDIEVDTNKAGTYYKYYDFNGYLLRRRIVVGDFVTDFVYTGGPQSYDALYDGYYFVELWGARGYNETYGGKGAYTSGIVHLNKGESLYVYVGGAGGSNATSSNIGGYNGGGYSGNHQDSNSFGGGGSTDIRLVHGAWNDTIGLNSRIMVAAGGAGTTSILSSKAGDGGTILGGDGTSSNSSFNTADYLPKGATQVGSGFAYQERSGSFGFAPQAYFEGGGGGGGGGYYGGNTGYGTTGSGGSSFISGYAGVNAITSESDRTHTNNTLHYSNKYFLDGSMEAGVNAGNGKAKIVYIGSFLTRNEKLDNVRFIKDCINGNNFNTWNHWIELQAIKDGVNMAYGKTVTAGNMVATLPRLVDGSITTGYTEGNTCVIVDLGEIYDLDEIAVWFYYADGRAYKNHYLYVSSDNSNWTTLINNVSGIKSTPNGMRVSAYD